MLLAMSNKKHCFLDLFAGAGGLSEGFIRAGFHPVAHVEMNTAACFTLKTRMSRHWLFEHNQEEIYYDYLHQKLSRENLYQAIPQEILSSVINKEISDITLSNIFELIDERIGDQKIDLIIGGPPCQAYSPIGRARDGNGMKDDKRNYLFQYYARFLEKYQPACFVFENVTGLLSAKDKEGTLYFNMMKDAFYKAGYEIEKETLTASDYGVLQTRKRVILVGKKGKQDGFYPYPEKWNPEVYVNEIFADLPALSAGTGSTLPCATKAYNGNWLYDSGIKNNSFPVTLHQARPHNKTDLEIYQKAVGLWNNGHKRLNYNALPDSLKTHKNRDSFTDRFKVVAGDLPYCHTIVAHIAKDGHYYIHPDISQNRSITPREAARLQTFPDDYYFESEKATPNRTDAFQQIGNAVPVLMAEKIAQKLMEAW